MTPEELSALAQQSGATHFSPPPMRAVRGWSFTHDQLAAFADALAAQPARAGGDARDAARYRWLRSTTNSFTNSGGEKINVKLSPAEFDAAVDAALAAAAPQPAPAEQQEWPKLTKRARVGNGTFGVGVSSRLVVEAAQRHEEQRKAEAVKTPEQLREDERNRRKLWDMIHGPVEPKPAASPTLAPIQRAREDTCIHGKGFQCVTCWPHPAAPSDAVELHDGALAFVERDALKDWTIHRTDPGDWVLTHQWWGIGVFNTDDPSARARITAAFLSDYAKAHGVGSSKEGKSA